MSNTKKTNHLSQQIKNVIITSTLFILSTGHASVTLDYLNAKSEIAQGTDISAFDSLKSNPLYPYFASDFYENNLHRDGEILALLETEFSARRLKS